VKTLRLGLAAIAVSLALLATALTAPLSATADSEVGTSAISGRVTLKGTNADPNGPQVRPGAHIRVTVHRTQPNLTTPAFNTTTTVTNASGDFSFSNLPAGEYRISTSSTAPDTFNYTATYIGGPSARTATVFHVEAGQSLVVNPELNQGARISGSVNFPAGSELADGWAVLYSGGPVDDNWTRVTCTNFYNGQWAFQRIPLGTYRVGFTNNGSCMGADGDLQPSANGVYSTWYPSQATFAAASTITLSFPGQVASGVDAYFPAVPETTQPPVPLTITDYVALGDSFQSGEGALVYLQGTARAENRCHRSSSAYPWELLNRGDVFSGLQFWACSGAVASDLSQTTVESSPPYDDPIWPTSDSGAVLGTVPESYLGRLSDDTQLVTIGIGGNDLGFVPTLQACIAINNLGHTPCWPFLAPGLADTLSQKVEEGLWTDVFDAVRAGASNARVVVLGYPRFFVNDRNPSLCDFTTGVSKADQLWLNSTIRQVNSAIAAAAYSRGFQYVDIYDLPAGHELCSDSDDKFLNGIILANAEGTVPAPESYHPTPFAHGRIADAVSGALGTARPGSALTMKTGDTAEFRSTVYPGTATATYATSWPGSTVAMELVSPTGRVITSATVAGDVTRTSSATSEVFQIENPETGLWVVRLHGVDLDPAGEIVVFNEDHQAAPNQAPTAVISASQNGFDLEVSSAGSLDPEGTSLEYLWDFGDGTVAEGATASHTYAEPGAYVTSLVAIDGDGESGFASQDTPVVAQETSRIVYVTDSAGAFKRNLATMEPDGTDVTALTVGSGIDGTPEWSPDQSRIAFSSTRAGNTDIYVVNADGTNLTRLTTASAVDTAPAWSPDGSRIVFSSTRTGLGDLYSMNADGTSLQRLTSTMWPEMDPAWSPDGSRIAYTSHRNLTADVYTMNSDGTGALRITSSLSGDRQPTWSPDGTELAFSSLRSGNGDIYVVSATGTGLRRVTNASTVDLLPDWSPDGTSLTFTGVSGANADIYRVHLDGSGVGRLTTRNGYDGHGDDG
jgi:hypothetical protein